MKECVYEKWNEINEEEIAKEADFLFQELFPICRSISGDGVRETFEKLQKIATFDIHEIKSGTICYDWQVPKEWNITDAYIQDNTGRKIVDFKKNNVHIVSYSCPVEKKISFQDLQKHLYSIPELPKAIPYRTFYYKEDWGFCVQDELLKSLDTKADYYVKIDSKLEMGSLTYGDCLLNGFSGKEYFFSAYSCHPSLANDNLSGIILWTLLLKYLKKQKLYHSYRFALVPETIGAIVYLHENEGKMKKVSGGFVIATVAGNGKISYKESFLGNSEIDLAIRQCFLEEKKEDFIYYPFSFASDERQYSSPYFRIPIASICKDKYYEYDYYHTSLDDLNFVSGFNLVQTLKYYIKTIKILEMNRKYESLMPYCEPMLGKRNLYPALGGYLKQKIVDEGYQADGNYLNEQDMMFWLMFYADGENDLLSVAKKSGASVESLFKIANKLCRHNLLKEIV